MDCESKPSKPPIFSLDLSPHPFCFPLHIKIQEVSLSIMAIRHCFLQSHIIDDENPPLNQFQFQFPAEYILPETCRWKLEHLSMIFVLFGSFWSRPRKMKKIGVSFDTK